MRSASYVFSAATRSRYGRASNAARSAAVANEGQESPIRRSSKWRAVMVRTGVACAALIVCRNASFLH
jgi:hypothetical protein